MKNNKKCVLFVCNYLPTDINSVSEILKCLYSLEYFSSYKKVFARYDKSRFEPTEKERYNSSDVFYIKKRQSFSEIMKDKRFTFSSKVATILRRFLYQVSSNCDTEHVSFFKRVFKKSKPTVVVFLTFYLELDVAKFLSLNNTDFYVFLFDTILNRPYLDSKKIIDIENEIISLSKHYFVPSFFYDDYLKEYNYPQLSPYNLPLVIDKGTIKNTYKICNNGNIDFDYLFSYFGQIQTFRNLDKISEVFTEINKPLNVFSPDYLEKSDGIIYHKPLAGIELFEAVVRSNFLVFFDNSIPYNHYLPSKAYLYVSFTKPIIIFGDNISSATIDFFRKYPICYYHHLGSNLEGLKTFIFKYIGKNIGFIDDIYNNFSNNTKEESMAKINQIFLDNNYDKHV